MKAPTVCQMCVTEENSTDAEQDVLGEIEALKKRSDWINGMSRGAQQLLVDELAIAVAAESRTNFSWIEGLRSDVKRLRKQRVSSRQC